MEKKGGNSCGKYNSTLKFILKPNALNSEDPK